VWPWDGVLLLSGDLGSGKTVVTQGLGMALGIDYKQVQSPSFTLVREHEGNQGRLIHIDLYRLDNADLEALGLWEILAGPGLKAVEWGDKLPFEVPGAVRLFVEVLEPSNERRFEISGLDAAEVQLTWPESPGTDEE
jgi:tRNA threonylcarbamoyl adenosine modification protein YjeE